MYGTLTRENIKSNHHIFRIFALLGGILWSGITQAQEACFIFVGDSVGCAPFTVRIRSCAVGTAGVSHNFDFQQGDPLSDWQTLNPGPEAEHIYSLPGTYVIDQFRGGFIHTQRIVRVFNATARPVFTWTSCLDTLRIQFQDTVFSTFKFDPGDGSGEQDVFGGQLLLKYKYNFPEPDKTFDFTIKGQIPATCSRELITNRATLYKTYIPPLADSLVGIDTLHYRTVIQIRADEPFVYQRLSSNSWNSFQNGITNNAESNHSDTLSFADLQEKERIRVATQTGCGDTVAAPEWMVLWPQTQSDNQKITLTWPGFDLPDMAAFSLLRNGEVIANLFNKPDTMYVDSSQLVCGKTYCYQFLIRQKKGAYMGQLVYLSAPICAQATSNLPADPVHNISGTVLENGIEISAKMSPIAKTYSLYRKEKEGNDFIKLMDTNKLPVLDSLADFDNRAYCYKIGFLDICGNESKMSDVFCPVWLRVETPDEFEKNLFWTSLDGWNDGVKKYILLRFSEGDATLSTDAQTATSFSMSRRDSAGQEVCYQIQSFANNNTAYPNLSLSNKVCITQKAKLLFPEVFTPNDDRTNDEFRCYNLFIKEFEMKIFNVWGEIIYYSTDIRKGWNGKIEGKLAASGGYVYWAQGVDEKGNTMKTKGYFALVR